MSLQELPNSNEHGSVASSLLGSEVLPPKTARPRRKNGETSLRTARPRLKNEESSLREERRKRKTGEPEAARLKRKKKESSEQHPIEASTKDDSHSIPIICRICLEELHPFDLTLGRKSVGQRQMAVSECGHVYCYPCIRVWITMKNTCPLCRKRLEKPFFPILL